MTTHIWKKMLSSLLCGILSVSCMTATVFAIDGKSVSGAFGEHWDEVQESYETSFAGTIISILRRTGRMTTPETNMSGKQGIRKSGIGITF